MKKHENKTIYTIIIIVSFMIIYAFLAFGTSVTTYVLNVDDISPADIFSPRNVVDKITTEQMKNAARQQVPDAYVIDSQITQKMERSLADLNISLGDLRQGLDAVSELDDEEKSIILALSDYQFERAGSLASTLQKELALSGITNTSEAMYIAENRLEMVEPAVTNTVLLLLDKTLSVNKMVDQSLTEQERNRAADLISDVEYKASQIIVRKGEKITPAQWRLLADLGIIRTKSFGELIYYLSLGLLVAFTLAALYLHRMAKDLKSMSIISVVLAVSVAIIFAAKTYLPVDVYVIPTALPTALTAVLAGIPAAMAVNVAMALFSLIIIFADAYYLAATLMIGTACAIIFSKMRDQKSQVLAATANVVSGFVCCFTISLTETSDLMSSLFLGGYGSVGALITSVLLIGSLPFWELVFGIVTPYKLLELANPNTKLLKRLLTEAPGTYHHSLMVSNMAEVACDKIGANAPLARTAAYYHDVGKLKSPGLFKENILGDNPHDFLKPLESAKIITEHVLYGAEIARQYRLPPPIEEIILSHHGTTTTAFFLHQEKRTNPDTDESAFRYKGMKPQNKEAAVIMLADSVEAAVRSMSSHDEQSVSKMIDKVFHSKISDGQFDDCPLSFRDIPEIKTAFMQALDGYFHKRIQYPEN